MRHVGVKILIVWPSRGDFKVDLKLLLLRISEMCGVTLRKDTHALLQGPEPLSSDFEVQSRPPGPPFSSRLCW